MKKELESDIQIQIVEYLTLMAPSRGFFFFSCPNEAMGQARGKGGLARMAKLKRMGLRPGVADLVIIKAGRAYFLEVKRHDGKMSVNQKEFAILTLSHDALYAVVYSFDEALKTLQSWDIVE